MNISVCRKLRNRACGGGNPNDFCILSFITTYLPLLENWYQPLYRDHQVDNDTSNRTRPSNYISKRSRHRTRSRKRGGSSRETRGVRRAQKIVGSRLGAFSGFRYQIIRAGGAKAMFERPRGRRKPRQRFRENSRPIINNKLGKESRGGGEGDQCVASSRAKV